MRAIFVLCSVLLLVFYFPASAAVATGTNSCRDCHTNDSALKALFKPPAMEVAEGEG